MRVRAVNAYARMRLKNECRQSSSGRLNLGSRICRFEQALETHSIEMCIIAVYGALASCSGDHGGKHLYATTRTASLNLLAMYST